MKRRLPVLMCLISGYLAAQTPQQNYDPFPMTIDVGNFNLTMNKLNGEGGLQTQFSWMLTGANPSKTEIFYWPQDRWQSNILYQIFNPVVLDDNGILDEFGQRQLMYRGGGETITNAGVTDWAIEIRRYRPPNIVVDGIQLNPPYRWYIDRNIKSDIKLEFEDVLPQFGIRSHVEVYAFSNQFLGDFFIWKATHKFTGEVRLPRQASASTDTLPNQTINFWWPLAFSFGPSKAGEYYSQGGFSYEGEDDLDSWFKRKSQLVTGTLRDSLYVAYYWDGDQAAAPVYANGSGDDTGDPDRVSGFLHSTQIPGYTLLYADKAYNQKVDDPVQPYSMPHGTIAGDFWGTRGLSLKQIYTGNDSRGRFPLDAITEGFTGTQKGPMRFITVGPYSLTKDKTINRSDSLTFVYGVGVGSIGWEAADSIGGLWMQKQISDSVKDSWVRKGVDSLWKVLDLSNWTWNRLSNGLSVPTPPPPPDISVTSGPDRITVSWSYPDVSYFLDPETGTNDWYAWRVYRKRGAFLVIDPLDQRSYAKWELVFETTNVNQTTFVDMDIQRGVDYYYAVTAVDNGTQNTSGLFTGIRLESSRYATRSQLPATSFKPGLSESGLIRVVPNPATVAAGGLAFSGTPNKILFVNLPVSCTLRIYTETGDLVKTIQHFGTGDHEWDQRTDDNQYVTSGIYILAATDCQGLNGEPLDNQFVKFVLIR